MASAREKDGGATADVTTRQPRRRRTDVSILKHNKTTSEPSATGAVLRMPNRDACSRMRRLAALYGIDVSDSTDQQLTEWAATSVLVGGSLGVNMRDMAAELKKLHDAAHPPV
jgi:hypothetical protein